MNTSCFPNTSQGFQQIMYAGVTENMVSSSLEATSGVDTHSNSLLYSLSALKEKVNQVQSLVSIFVSPDQNPQAESTAMAIASVGTLIQEIIVTASSMMFTCQQMVLGSSSIPEVNNNTGELRNHRNNKLHERGHGLYSSGETLDWYGENYNNPIAVRDNNNEAGRRDEFPERHQNSEISQDIIELNVADLLAKYTHYCQVCGKGFKRDANLRMHMRAHGDEYKSSAALSNPMKNRAESTNTNKENIKMATKYSCPQEGCRWNKKHAKFQPLKSMICVKNHYKRSHCPKMYVCKRCNTKQFSVLSDLRTHEKHCGDLKWKCSCGTTFSRKDKLMGHVALFVGHTPATTTMTINSSWSSKIGKVEQHDQVPMRVYNNS